jgi:hypothetical protein
MGKTQKIKGMGLVVFPVSPASLFSVQVDDTSFLRMQFKSELRKSFSHLNTESCRENRPHISPDDKFLEL